MKDRRLLAILSLCLGTCAVVLSPVSNRAADEPAVLKLSDPAGKTYALHDAGAKAVVLFFSSSTCPSASRYVERLALAHKQYSPRGVTFFAVYAGALETAKDIETHARRAKLPFPALRDPEQRAADAFKVSVTPTVVVLDAKGQVRYHGSVDDHRTETLVKRRYLHNALDAVLAGKAVAIKQTEADGCTIERKLVANSKSTVTYSGEVAAILHKNCATCHRPGDVGPFPLLTYEQARRQAHNIKRYTRSGAMPPWKPVNHDTFRDERRLTAKEIDLIGRWVDAGAPVGDAKKVPAPPKVAEGWQLGKPDLILEAPEYELAATGSDVYRCFVLDPKLTEDHYVRAVEFQAGNKRVVHHLMTYIDVLGSSAERKSNDGQPGYSTRGTGPGFLPAGDLGGWAPGSRPHPLPDGTARLLSRNAKIVLEVHYHKNGRREKDRSRIGIYFARKPADKLVRTQYLLNLRFKIPAGDRRHEVNAAWTVRGDVEVLAILPHMHLIGREMLVTATFPKGGKKTLVHIKDWDFNWQETYFFKEPLKLPAGTKVELSAWYDNSAANPNNPNSPPRDVRFGLQTTDEMCVAYLAYTRGGP